MNLQKMNKRNFSPFIINRWLSMDKDFIEIVKLSFKSIPLEH